MGGGGGFEDGGLLLSDSLGVALVQNGHGLGQVPKDPRVREVQFLGGVVRQDPRELQTQGNRENAVNPLLTDG